MDINAGFVIILGIILGVLLDGKKPTRLVKEKPVEPVKIEKVEE